MRRSPEQTEMAVAAMEAMASGPETRFDYDATKSENRRRAPGQTITTEDRLLTPQKRQRVTASTSDLYRNFSIAAWMIRKHLDYVSTFDFQCKSGNEDLDKQVEALMREAGRAVNFDVGNRHDLKRTVRLLEAMRTLSGDCFLMTLSSGRFQAIEGDRIRTPKNGAPQNFNEEEWTHGIKLAKGGAARLYAINSRSKRGSGYEFESFRPARHVYQHAYFTRFDQVRGVSPLTTAINTLQDTYEGFDYALAKAKVSQLFAMVFYREAFEQLDNPTTTSETGEEETTGTSRYNLDFGKGPVALDLDEGDRAEFLESKNPSQEFQQFTETMIQVALKSLDIPYSFYNESHTNFFGSKGALMQYEKSCNSKREDNGALLNWITFKRLRLAILNGELDLARYGLKLSELKFQWIHRGTPWWDPAKEVKGDMMAVGAGFNTPQRICRERGSGDFYENVDEIAKAKAYAEEKGVVLNFPDSSIYQPEVTVKGEDDE